MAGNKNSGRKPKERITPTIPARQTRAEALDWLRHELEETTADLARGPLIRLILQIQGHLEAEPRRTSPPRVPSDPLEYTRYRLRDVRSRLQVASGIAYTRLLDSEARLLREIDDLTPAPEQTQEQQITALVAELADWPDLAISLVVEEAKRRGLL